MNALKDLLARLRGSSDEELAALERLLSDARVHTEHHPSGPTFRIVAEEAIAALVEVGPPALPILARATRSKHTVTASEAAYDQGVYIGEYGTRTVSIASAAAEAIRIIGRKHPGSVPWVAMKKDAWFSCDDPATLVRAVFDRSEHATLREHLRGFLATTCKGHTPEVDAAIAVAEHAAFGHVSCDQMTAAHAAALHAGVLAVAYALELNFDVERAIEALSFAPKANAELLRRNIPLWGNVDPPRSSFRGPWDALLDAVIANPDEDAPRLAFAKWLTDRDDPRGEYITLQCANGSRERQAELVAAYGKSWTRWPDDASFARGFVEGTGPNLAAFRGEPTARDVGSWRSTPGSWLDALAAMPEARRIRRITIRGAHFRPLDLEQLCASYEFITLREVIMQGCGLDMACVEKLATWPAIAQLTLLDLTSNGLPAEAHKILPMCAT